MDWILGFFPIFSAKIHTIQRFYGAPSYSEILKGSEALMTPSIEIKKKHKRVSGSVDWDLNQVLVAE